jgi:hypothetical protein
MHLQAALHPVFQQQQHEHQASASASAAAAGINGCVAWRQLYRRAILHQLAALHPEKRKRPQQQQQQPLSGSVSSSSSNDLGLVVVSFHKSPDSL